MRIILYATVVLAAFIVVWFLFVVPAERRHHERKLKLLRGRIEKHETADQDQVETKDE